MPRRLPRFIELLEAFAPLAGETLESLKVFPLFLFFVFCFAFWRISIGFCFWLRFLFVSSLLSFWIIFWNLVHYAVYFLMICFFYFRLSGGPCSAFWCYHP